MGRACRAATPKPASSKGAKKKPRQKVSRGSLAGPGRFLAGHSAGASADGSAGVADCGSGHAMASTHCPAGAAASSCLRDHAVRLRDRRGRHCLRRRRDCQDKSSNSNQSDHSCPPSKSVHEPERTYVAFGPEPQTCQNSQIGQHWTGPAALDQFGDTKTMICRDPDEKPPALRRWGLRSSRSATDASGLTFAPFDPWGSANS
jgi:hypothetical protein